MNTEFLFRNLYHEKWGVICHAVIDAIVNWFVSGIVMLIPKLFKTLNDVFFNSLNFILNKCVIWLNLPYGRWISIGVTFVFAILKHSLYGGFMTVWTFLYVLTRTFFGVLDIGLNIYSLWLNFREKSWKYIGLTFILALLNLLLSCIFSIIWTFFYALIDTFFNSLDLATKKDGRWLNFSQSHMIWIHIVNNFVFTTLKCILSFVFMLIWILSYGLIWLFLNSIFYSFLEDCNREHVEYALTPHLKSILKNDIDYDENEAKENVKFMWDALSRLVSVMKDMDPLFAELYKNRLVHAGSFYEELRVATPDEFDIQMVLELPFLSSSFTISKPNADSPYETYKLNQDPQQVLYTNNTWHFPYNKLANFFDNDGFLSSAKFQQWIHGLADKALKSDAFTRPRTVSKIKRKAQPSTCPAFTLEITGASTGRTIDVDLVPVIDTRRQNVPRKMHQGKRFRNLLHSEENIQWFLVPKPLKDYWGFNRSSQNLWRSTFPASDKKLLSDTGCLKDMIKICKRLRDLNRDWRKPIYSSLVKSFFLRKFDKNPSSDYWSDNNLGKVFMESLEEFKTAMENGHIPDYSNPKANMAANVDRGTAARIVRRIGNITNTVLQSPKSIKDVFKSQEDYFRFKLVIVVMIIALFCSNP